jgi:hypothetical protein
MPKVSHGITIGGQNPDMPANSPGSVELPLTCARVSDPDNIGLEYWYAGSPPNDPRFEFCGRRLRYYDLVLDSLIIFEAKSASAKASAATAGVVALDDPETVRSHAYELAFSSEDEMFHSTMYDWLINRQLADELLEVCVIDHLISRLLNFSFAFLRCGLLSSKRI